MFRTVSISVLLNTLETIMASEITSCILTTPPIRTPWGS